MIAKAVVRIVFVTGLWLALIGTGEASVIRLSISPTAELAERFLILSVSVKNEGDEPALHLRATIEAGGRSVTLKGPGRLAPGDHQILEAGSVPVGWLQPGSYSVVIRLDYQDGNGYPFSTLVVAPVSRWEEPLSPVHLTVESGEFAASGIIRVQVTNRDRRPYDVRLEVLTSHEFTVTPRFARLVLAPRQAEEVRFTLKSKTALPGSAYPVFAIADGVHQDRHISTTAHATVQVLNSSSGSTTAVMVMIAIGILPLLLLALHRLRSRVAPRAGARPSRRALPTRSPV